MMPNHTPPPGAAQAAACKAPSYHRSDGAVNVLPEELSAFSRFEGEGGPERPIADSTLVALPVKRTKSSPIAGISGNVRRLKRNEIVKHGDFVADQHHKFEAWEGPGGFRADAFVKPIYRKEGNGSSSSRTPAPDADVEFE